MIVPFLGKRGEPVAAAPLCSGIMTRGHDGSDPQIIDIFGHDVAMCRPCRDAAGRLGMIERRQEERTASA